MAVAAGGVVAKRAVDDDWMVRSDDIHVAWETPGMAVARVLPLLLDDDTGGDDTPWCEVAAGVASSSRVVPRREHYSY